MDTRAELRSAYDEADTPVKKLAVLINADKEFINGDKVHDLDEKIAVDWLAMTDEERQEAADLMGMEEQARVAQLVKSYEFKGSVVSGVKAVARAADAVGEMGIALRQQTKRKEKARRKRKQSRASRKRARR